MGRELDNAEELLAHGAWLRRLALRIVRDADVADDLVQDTWAATVRRPPERGESVKPWLAKVLVNALRMRVRSEGRRAAREQATMLLDDEVPTPDVLVARAEAQRKLVDLVLRLDEPYRSTVLLHFCEGVSLADIARAQGIPAGTVRWRLKTAIEQLRRWLDAESGSRKQWAVALLAVPKGMVVAKKTNLVLGVVVLLLLLLGGAVWLVARDRGGDATGAGGGGTASALAAQRGGGGDGLGSDPEAQALPSWLAPGHIKSRRIAGRVTHQGQPVSGASVELASLATESGLAIPARRTTNAAGEFDFGPQRAMQWSVRASGPGKVGAALEIDLRDPLARPAPDRLELQLRACDAALFGTVRDASGGPIQHARLAWLVAEHYGDVPGGPAVETDENGVYELCVAPAWPGLVRVEVSAVGYGSIVFRGFAPGRTRADFALVPEATIVGRVVRDDTGAPIPLALVFVPQGPFGTETTAWRSTFTDKQGRFRLDRVAPGRHLVFARADGMVTAAGGTPVVVEAGRPSAELEIRLEAGATLRGVVMADGKPVAGAHVRSDVLGRGFLPMSTVSQADGSFVLEQVPLGEQRFSAFPYEVVKPATFRVTEREHAGIVIEVEPLGAIVGRVVRNRLPVADARVVISGPNEGDLPMVRSDADGRFEVRGLWAGPWTLYASDEAAGAFGRAPKTIHITAGNTEEVTIDLPYSASVTGTVVDQHGVPVPAVHVELHHTRSDDGGVAVTANDGTFHAAMMTGGGSYSVTVSPSQQRSTHLRPARGDAFPPIELPGPDSHVTGVVLAVQLDHLAISGTVVDTSGAPIADARVTATLTKAGEKPHFLRWVQHAAATTDVDGHFTITDLPAGTYAVNASANARAETTVTGIRAGTGDVQLILPMPASIDGTLVGFTKVPQVTAMQLDGPGGSIPIHGVVTGTRFVVRDLTPGTYVVEARTASEAASARVQVTSGGAATVTLTSGGSGTIVGRVVDFRSGKPVEGMICRAMPRASDEHIWMARGDISARTDARGAFTLSSVPAGDIAVGCVGLWRLYTDGLRLVTLPRDQQLKVDVPVVAWTEEPGVMLASMGAHITAASGAIQTGLLPHLYNVVPGGPAATAGFQNGDLVVAVDGASVTELSPRGVLTLIVNRPVGSKVEITVSRAGKTVTGMVTLREDDR